MIRIKSLIGITPLKPLTEDSIDDDQVESTEKFDSELFKAKLLNITKRAGELYNMVGDQETLEGWIHERIDTADECINSVYQFVNYEKTKYKTIGNGEKTSVDGTV